MELERKIKKNGWIAKIKDLVAVQNLSSQETNSIPQDQISTADMDGVCNT